VDLETNIVKPWPSAGARAGVRAESLSEWQLTLAVWLGAFLVLSPGLFWGIPSGKTINGALRILAGEIPYRDFWTMYAPGQFYLVAALFYVFGFHVMVQGAAVLFLIASSASVLFHILRRRLGLPVKEATILAGLFVLTEWSVGREVSSYETLVLCALLAINFLLRYFEGEGRRNLVWAGACYGVGAWFKHDVAFYLTAGSALALFLAWIAAGRSRPPEWLSPAGAIARLAGAAAVVVLPVAGFFAWKAGPDIWQDLVRFPATDFPIVRGEPYPPFLRVWNGFATWLGDLTSPANGFTAFTHLSVWILAHMPEAVFVFAASWLYDSHRRLAPSKLAAGVLFLASMPFFWTAAHVQQNTHLISMAIMSLLIGALVWTELPGGEVSRRLRRILLVGLAVYAAGMVLRPALSLARVAYLWPKSHVTDIPMVRGSRAPDDSLDVYEPIVRFVRQNVPPGEPIYVGVVRHDAIVINNQSFYYLAERPSATRYNELHPGLADDPWYQREMIDDINRHQVRCIVLWRFGWSDRYLDSIRDYRRARLPQLGATLLDEFLQREFEVLAQYGEYDLMWRRGVPRPAGF
jgi:hypothetical protein